MIPFLFLALAVASCVRYSPPAPVVAGADSHRGTPRGAGPLPVPGPHPDSIIVAPGQTLYGVSRQYGVPLRSIIDANALQPPFLLRKGQHLLLPQVRTYTVHAGDTLTGISRRFGVDASTLASTNHLEPPYRLLVGQAVALPAPVQMATAHAAAPLTSSAEPVAPASPRSAIEAETLPPPVARAEARPAPAKSAPPRETLPERSRPPQHAVAETAPVQKQAPPPAPEQKPAARAPEQTVAAAEPHPPAAPAPRPTKEGFQWPVRGTILVGFGPSTNGTQNDGINIAAPTGTPVEAAKDGVVAYAGNELRGFGNLILIKHADGWTTAYAHCQKLLVKRGDHVRRGETIARVGQTGAVKAPQLHFEIRRGTRALDPVDYLPPVSTAAAE